MNYRDVRVWSFQCGKWRYPTRPYAMDALVEFRALRRYAPDAERAVYYCCNRHGKQGCHGWHLTHLIQLEINNNAPDLRKAIEKGTITR